jgi:uncharacterized protein YndB with AHSA1/START domain
MKRDLKLVRTYRHAPEVVWHALTDSTALAEWLMENDFQPVVGHRFQFHTQPAPGFDGVVDCQVLVVAAPRRLSYSWKGGPIDTVLTFTLDEVPEGTRLTVEQTGFTGLKAVMVSLILQSGNANIYDRKLPAVLDRIVRDGVLVPSEGEKGCEGSWSNPAVKALEHVTNWIPK